MKQFIFLLTGLFFSVISTQAQFSVVASSFLNPAGIEADASGNIWLAETGTGSNNGRIVVVKPNGDKVPVIQGLPSFTDPTIQETSGAWRTMFLPSNQLAVIIGGGPTKLFGRIMIFNFNRYKLGSSPIKTLADTVRTIDISGFVLSQPGYNDSNPFSAVLDERGDWYVADAGANIIVKVARTGYKSIFAKFAPFANPTPVGPPMVDAVPTKIIAKKGGGFYVSTLTGFPFNQGKASIYSLDMRGNLQLFKGGLSLLTDLSLDSRTGDLYALQFGSFAFAPVPGYVAGSGKVWRIAARGGSVNLIADKFGPGSGMSFDRQGNLYVTSIFDGKLLKMKNVLKGHDDNCHFLEAAADDETYSYIPNLQKPSKSMLLETYPNPATQNITISWGEMTPQYLRLLDVSGKVVFEKTDLNEGTTKQRIDVQSLNAGVYFLQLNTANGIESRKIMVQK